MRRCPVGRKVCSGAGTNVRPGARRGGVSNVGLFRRGGKDAATDEVGDAVDAAVDESVEEVDELDEVVDVAATPFERVGGPWDSEEVTDDIARVDLGAIKLPGVPGMELRMEIDKATDTV